MAPSIGLIVDFVTVAGTEVPAIVTRVRSDSAVNLRVFYDNAHGAGDFFESCMLDESAIPASGTWHYAGDEHSDGYAEEIPVPEPAEPEPAKQPNPAV